MPDSGCHAKASASAETTCALVEDHGAHEARNYPSNEPRRDQSPGQVATAKSVSYKPSSDLQKNEDGEHER